MRVVVMCAVCLILVGCAGAGMMSPDKMSPEQLEAWAKIKDATIGCAKGTYAGANVMTTWANIDKGIPAGVTIKDSCEITFDAKRPTPQ